MKKQILVYSFLVSLTMSCNSVYHPMTTDVPLISEKNDLRVGCRNFNCSFRPMQQFHTELTNKIAVQGFGSAGADDKYYVQVASGIYRNRGDNTILELYGGLGLWLWKCI